MRPVSQTHSKFKKKKLDLETSRLKKFMQYNKKKLVYISTYSVNDNSRKNKLYVKKV